MAREYEGATGMVLKTTHDTQEEIPENFRELYTEKNGKFELTGIQGVKTPTDVTRVQTALTKEQDAHKATKSLLEVWGDLKSAEVLAKLDKMPELEAAAKGKLDEAQIEEIVSRRVDGTINSQKAPLERKISEQGKLLEDLKKENSGFRSDRRTRKIHDHVRKAAIASKMLPAAVDDALLLADKMFEIREDDGEVVTRDNVGVTPGIPAKEWLDDMQPTRRHWWPESIGGKSSGSGSGGGGGDNPWSAEHWNMTKQGEYLKANGREAADRRAKSAGTKVGGLKPEPKVAARA